MSPDSVSPSRPIFLPLLLLGLSLLSMTGFQTYQLLNQQNNLKAARDGQIAAVAESQRIRTQLQSIARGTADLAEQGNANARRVVQELERQGISVSPESGAAP